MAFLVQHVGRYFKDCLETCLSCIFCMYDQKDDTVIYFFFQEIYSLFLFSFYFLGNITTTIHEVATAGIVVAERKHMDTTVVRSNVLFISLVCSYVHKAYR